MLSFPVFYWLTIHLISTYVSATLLGIIVSQKKFSVSRFLDLLLLCGSCLQAFGLVVRYLLQSVCETTSPIVAYRSTVISPHYWGII